MAIDRYALAVVRPADALTAARAVAAIPVSALILAGRHQGASILFALGGLTDVLDGWLARRSGATPLGTQLDPLADKLLADSALLALAARGRVPWPAVLTLVARDVAITVLRATGHEALPPTAAARLKTGLLYASIAALLRAPRGSTAARVANGALVVAVGLAALSAWDYVRRRETASPGSRPLRAPRGSRTARPRPCHR